MSLVSSPAGGVKFERPAHLGGPFYLPSRNVIPNSDFRRRARHGRQNMPGDLVTRIIGMTAEEVLILFAAGAELIEMAKFRPTSPAVSIPTR